MELPNHTFVKRKYNASAREFLDHLLKNPHPNLPVIVEVTDDYYVMEYVCGKTLCDIVEESVLSSDVAKKYMLQLLDAVEVMHGFKIVHRDIKPENIVVTDDGTLKLIDFDISRKIVENKKNDTDLLGTAGYAAPEQYGFMQTDERSDIYSIGIVYNYMLTGKKPIEQAASGQVGKIIRKCTQIDNEDRYKSIKLLHKDIIKGRFTSYKLFDITPGFRTRNPYKMFFAAYIYFCWIATVIIVFSDLVTNQGMNAFEAAICIALYVIYCVPFYAMALNYKGFTDRIKFPIKKQFFKKIVLLLIWYTIGTAFLFATSGDIKESIMMNPVFVSLFMPGYIFYSIIESIKIGML